MNVVVDEPEGVTCFDCLQRGRPDVLLPLGVQLWGLVGETIQRCTNAFEEHLGRMRAQGEPRGNDVVNGWDMLAMERNQPLVCPHLPLSLTLNLGNTGCPVFPFGLPLRLVALRWRGE